MFLPHKDFGAQNPTIVPQRIENLVLLARLQPQRIPGGEGIET